MTGVAQRNLPRLLASRLAMAGSAIFVLLLQTSCSKESLENAKTQLISVKDSVAAVAPITPVGVTLGPTPSIKLDECFATFTPPMGGRSAVLQIASYKASAAEEFPSVYFRAIVPTTNRATLAGQTISGELFVQMQKDGELWSSSYEQPAEFKCSASGEWSITVDVSNVKMERADQAGTAQLSGNLVGSWQ